MGMTMPTVFRDCPDAKALARGKRSSASARPPRGCASGSGAPHRNCRVEPATPCPCSPRLPVPHQRWWCGSLAHPAGRPPTHGPWSSSAEHNSEPQRVDPAETAERAARREGPAAAACRAAIPAPPTTNPRPTNSNNQPALRIPQTPSPNKVADAARPNQRGRRRRRLKCCRWDGFPLTSPEPATYDTDQCRPDVVCDRFRPWPGEFFTDEAPGRSTWVYAAVRHKGVSYASHPRRAIAVAATTLFAGIFAAPSAQADIMTFPDVGAHITSVRVSHGPRTVGVTAYDADMTFGTYYQFWLDTNPTTRDPSTRPRSTRTATGSS